MTKRKRLTEAQVEEILRLAYEDGVSSHDLSESYDVSHQNIRYIIRGETWQDVFKRVVGEGKEIPKRTPVTKGEQHGGSKFTQEDVDTIRKRVEAGENKRELAWEYDVNYRTIHRICIGESWKEETEDE